jgi:hypothetical protein
MALNHGIADGHCVRKGPTAQMVCQGRRWLITRICARHDQMGRSSAVVRAVTMQQTLLPLVVPQDLMKISFIRKRVGTWTMVSIVA